ATFFKSQPQSEAAQGVATHINKFLYPRMRRQLFEILENEENGLDALVLQAAPLIRKPEPVTH
ncbi:formate dehydrogenase subunit delta, partial [Rhizobium ruizarguesonis]